MGKSTPPTFSCSFKRFCMGWGLFFFVWLLKGWRYPPQNGVTNLLGNSEKPLSVKENRISSMVSKILRYRHTDTQTEILLLYYKNLWFKGQNESNLATRKCCKYVYEVYFPKHKHKSNFCIFLFSLNMRFCSDLKSLTNNVYCRWAELPKIKVL